MIRQTTKPVAARRSAAESHRTIGSSVDAQWRMITRRLWRDHRGTPRRSTGGREEQNLIEMNELVKLRHLCVMRDQICLLTPLSFNYLVNLLHYSFIIKFGHLSVATTGALGTKPSIMFAFNDTQSEFEESTND